MQFVKFKHIATMTLVLLGLASLGLGSPLEPDDRTPELPAGCEKLEVESGNKVSFHAYAIGIQRYRWNGTAWVLVEPVAKLYANDDYTGETGVHYLGPTWESNSGSKVVATRADGCNADPTAIDWLLLRAVTNDSSGPFRKVTYIQRVNTVGGRAPIAAGSSIGALIDVPYTAEYYFYKGVTD